MQRMADFHFSFSMSFHSTPTHLFLIASSAMFNILVIVALSAVIAGKGGVWLAVDWRPICRDVSFYIYSIGLLTYSFTNDSHVGLLESILMVGSYGVYIVFMKFNSFILGKCKSPKVDNESDIEAAVERTERALVDLSSRNSLNYSISMSSEGATATSRPQTMGLRHRQGSFMYDGSYSMLRRGSQTMGVRHRCHKYRRTSWKGAIAAVIAARAFAHKRVWELETLDKKAPETSSNNLSAHIEKSAGSPDSDSVATTTERNPKEVYLCSC